MNAIVRPGILGVSVVCLTLVASGMAAEPSKRRVQDAESLAAPPSEVGPRVRSAADVSIKRTGTGATAGIAQGAVPMCNFEDPECEKYGDCRCTVCLGELLVFDYCASGTPCTEDEVCVWAKTLPPGAEFPTVCDICEACSTFSWSPNNCCHVGTHLARLAGGWGVGYPGTSTDFHITVNDCDGTCYTVSAPDTWSGSSCRGNDCNLRLSPEVIYKVTIPNDARWTFSLCDSQFDTYLFVGTSCCGREIGENDNSDSCRPDSLQSLIEADLTAGTYYVAVESRYSSTCGDYTLNIFGCPDEVCQTKHEDKRSCPEDCCDPFCGDGVCDCPCGETTENCPADCVDALCDAGVYVGDIPIGGEYGRNGEMCVETYELCEPCRPQCDNCWCETEYENACPLWREGDGICDCGCQFDDDQDCGGPRPCHPCRSVPAEVCAEVFPLGPVECGSVDPVCATSEWDPVERKYIFCPIYTAGPCMGQACVRLWIDNPGPCNREWWWRFDQVCEFPDRTITVEIMTDLYPEDTWWEIVDKDTGAQVCSGAPDYPEILHSWDCCVDLPGCHNFTIYDARGDGICCQHGNGWYCVYCEGVLVRCGAQFGYAESVPAICECCGACGNGICQSDCGENCNTCPLDCLPRSVMWSDPPNCAIDARQPWKPDCTEPCGWNSIEITFDDDVSYVTEHDFSARVVPDAGIPPTIGNVSVEGNTATLVLDNRIPAGHWTCFEYRQCPSEVCLGRLRGDVNGNRTSAPADILWLIDCLNGVRSCEYWQCDADCSGVCKPLDILRVIDLLNAAGCYDPWLNFSLPPCPSGP